MARSIRNWTSSPSSLHVGISFHDMVSVTLVLCGDLSLSNTQSARTCSARQTPILRRIADAGAVWLPTSWVAASLPDRGEIREFRAGLFSMKTAERDPRASSRCRPFNRVGGLAAAMNFFTDLYGSVVLSHSLGGSAMIETGVRSRQLNGICQERQHVDERIGDEDLAGSPRSTSCT